jgi:hypothetical protein
MFLAAAVFAGLLGAITVWIAYAVRYERRLLETGRKSTVTVVSKHRDSKKTSPSVEIRLDDAPSEPPFFRTLLGDEWDRVKPGDKLAYVYDPADPRGGVLGRPQGTSALPCFMGAASMLIVPFLIVGIVLRIRERRAPAASGPAA